MEAGTMADPMERQRERELALRREQELKDLETRGDRRERPLEGLSAAPTTWTQDQDQRAAPMVHSHDQEESERRSLSDVLPAPPDRALPERGEDEG
jgi:hypothetical protein